MEKIKKYWLEIIGSIIALICLYYVVTFLNNLFNELYINSRTTECHEIYGYFGSYVGGVLGTIIGFITLFFVYITYTSQKKELILQRQLIAQQQFESTFFNMLNVHRELKNSLKLNKENNLFNGGLMYPNSDKIGVEVISKISNDFKKFYKSDFILKTLINENNLNYLITKILNDEFDKNDNLFKELEDPNNPEIDKFDWDENNNSIEYQKKKINFFFKYLFKNYQNQISHYCRNVYHILKYIRENEENKTLGNDSKKYKNYANIFQSQLNVDEQFLLFYNFIQFNDKENGIYSTIKLVNHYKFLENIGIDNLIFKKHKEFYDFVIKGSDRKIEKK